MTVTAFDLPTSYAGNGVTTAFATGFQFLQSSDLVVSRVVTATGAATTLILNTDYTVTGGNGSSGTVTCTTAPVVGTTLLIDLGMTFDQQVDYQPNDPFPANTHERALDKLTLIALQLKRLFARALTIPASETGNLVLPSIGDRANSILGFDALGNPIAASTALPTNRYYGSAASDPTTRSDGTALVSGDIYFNTVSNTLKAYNGSAWYVSTPASAVVDTFSGTGAQTVFTLSSAPGSKNATIVAISGVVQAKGSYSVSGTTLTFGVAPPLGTNNIEVTGFGISTPVGTPGAGSVGTTQLADAGVTTIKIADGGITTAKLDDQVVNGLTTVTAVTGDYVAIADVSDSNKKKKALVSDIVSLATASVVNSVQGFRNRIINGAFQVENWNFGAATTVTAGAALAYGVDQWYSYCTGANVTGQQTTTSSNLNRYRFTGAASNTLVGFGTRIESINSADMAGSSVTFSVKLSSTSLTAVNWAIYYANTKDTFGTIASPTRTSIGSGTFTINTTETTYSTTVTFPAGATTGIEIVLTTGALLAAQTLTIGDAQLEIGTVATPFERRSISLEQLLCERYLPFFKSPAANNSVISVGQCFSTTGAICPIYFRVEPFAVPTSIAISAVGDFAVTTAAAGSATVTVLTLNDANKRSGTLAITVASGLAAGNSTFIRVNGTASAYIRYLGCTIP